MAWLGGPHILHVDKVADALGDEEGGGGVQACADLVLQPTAQCRVTVRPLLTPARPCHIWYQSNSLLPNMLSNN